MLFASTHKDMKVLLTTPLLFLVFCAVAAASTDDGVTIEAEQEPTAAASAPPQSLRRHVRDVGDLLSGLLGTGSSGSLGSMAGSALQSASQVFKIAAIGYVAYLVLQFFFPGLVQSLLSQFSQGFQNVGQSVGRTVDVDSVVQKLGNLNLSDTAMSALNIQGTDCRQKASCQVGQYVAANYPSLAQVLFVFGNSLPVDPQYTGSLLRGASSSDCNALYPGCSYSPMQRLLSQSQNSV